MKASEFRKLISEEVRKVLNEMSVKNIKDKYINNPYGIGANAIEYIKGSNGNNVLVLRFKDSYHRDQAQKELRSLGIPAKKMSNKTQDKGYKYRYELNLFENVLKEQQSEFELIGPDRDELLDAITFINMGVKTNFPSQGMQPHSFGKNTLNALADDGHSISGGKFSIGVQPKTSNVDSYIKRVNKLLKDHGFECKLYRNK